MNILYLLLPLSLLFVLGIGVALWWAVLDGQYEEAEDASLSILRDKEG